MGDEEDREPLMPSQELVKNNLASFLELDGKKSVLFFVFIVLYCSNFWATMRILPSQQLFKNNLAPFWELAKKKFFFSSHSTIFHIVLGVSTPQTRSQQLCNFLFWNS